jgi:hypothetical protein
VLVLAPACPWDHPTPKEAGSFAWREQNPPGTDPKNPFRRVVTTLAPTKPMSCLDELTFAFGHDPPAPVAATLLHFHRTAPAVEFKCIYIHRSAHRRCWGVRSSFLPGAASMEGTNVVDDKSTFIPQARRRAYCFALRLMAIAFALVLVAIAALPDPGCVAAGVISFHH